MPTATSLSGFALVNVGPATTTFTAPASCATEYRTMIAATDTPYAPIWNAQCPWLPPRDCNPSGAVVDSLISSAGGLNPTDGLFIVYQSPGLICPAGQTTAGAAEKVNPTSTSISGAWDSSGPLPTSDRPAFPRQLDVFLAALDAGETAILCCPSSYVATNGACYSTIPRASFAPTGGCRLEGTFDNFEPVSGTWTLGGHTVTGELLSVTGTKLLSSVSTTFAASRATDYVGVAVEGMGILVHRAADIASVTAAPSSAATQGSQSTTKANGASSVGWSAGLGVVLIVFWTVISVTNIA